MAVSAFRRATDVFVVQPRSGVAGQRVLVAHPLLADLTVHQARGRERSGAGPGIFVAVRHLMDGARNGGDQRLERAGLWSGCGYGRRRCASATENAPPTPADGGHFPGNRIHLIAQRQRRVVHKDRCRFVAALEQLGFQPADGLVGQPAF